MSLGTEAIFCASQGKRRCRQENTKRLLNSIGTHPPSLVPVCPPPPSLAVCQRHTLVWVLGARPPRHLVSKNPSVRIQAPVTPQALQASGPAGTRAWVTPRRHGRPRMDACPPLAGRLGMPLRPRTPPPFGIRARCKNDSHVCTRSQVDEQGLLCLAMSCAHQL